MNDCCFDMDLMKRLEEKQKERLKRESMKKITVAQYAKNHSISDQAVRKRIKSGGIPESRIVKETKPDTVREQVFILAPE